MNISNVKSVVCIIPNSKSPSKDEQECSTTHLSTQQFQEEAEISMKIRDSSETEIEHHVWSVDRCVTHDISTPIEEEVSPVIKLALKGFNTACLFFHVGGDFYGNQKRHEGKKKIFDVLQKEVHATNTLIDFVYFCVTDSECYDLRMSETRTNKSVLEKGIDNWMHRVQHLKEIWDEVNSKGSKLPHIIKIRFTDILTHRTGSLCIFDLLQPKFLPPRESIPNNSSSCGGTANSYINESFQQLLELLDKVISPAIVTKDQFLHINLNVLTSLLAPFLCGYGKLVLFSYVMEYPKFLKLETVLALDFVIMLRSIKCKALHLHQSAADSSLRNRIHCLQYQSKKFQEEICCKDRLIKKLQLEKEISNKILIERTTEYNSETLKMERKIKDMNSNFALAKQNYYTDTKQLPLQSSCLNDEMINERRKNLKLHNTLSSANAKINLAKQHFLKLQKMVEKASMNAAENTNKIKSMAFHRISRLKRQLRNQKIQQIKEEKLLDILQKENNRLRQSVRVKELNLSREVQEKLEIKQYIGALKELCNKETEIK